MDIYMAIDGIFLHLVARELSPLCGNARVDKVHQPAKETLIFALRHRGGMAKLLLSASAQSPRVQLTAGGYENPASPPMLCMLLRKHLTSARLLSVDQAGLDRVLIFSFETRDELGDRVVLRLAVEVMGRHSNIVLFNEEGRILDAVKRIDPAMSSVRQVLPGLPYILPPKQDKTDLLSDGPDAAADKMLSMPAQPVHKAAMASIMGISPVVAGEIAGYASRSNDGTIAQLGQDGKDRLRFFLGRLVDQVRAGGTPTMLMTREGVPKDLSFLDMTQYKGLCITKTFNTYSELIDAFYAEKDLAERMKQRSGDLFRFLANLSERTERKLQHQREELLESRDRDRLRVQGDLLSANLYRLEKGMTTARVENYYDPAGGQVEIPLNPRLTPSQNAQRYFAEYRKADTAEKKLRELIEEGEAECRYLDSVLDALLRATGEAELEAIRDELAAGGYMRKRGQAVRQKQRTLKLLPNRYRSSDGFLILQGRGNVQNDRLTMKEARKNDLWFHTQNIPGSHVIVVSEGRQVPERTLEEAALIAAFNSKAKNSSQVPVDYTEVRNVRKPNGAKPGFVLYVNYKTAIVTPSRARVEALAENERQAGAQP